MRPFHLILPALLLASCAGPLNKAIAKNDKALVDQALAQGADINKDAHHSVRPLYWEAPLSQAVLKKKYDMAAYLIGKGALPKAGMRTAIDRDDPEAVAALLKAGAPVNERQSRREVSHGPIITLRPEPARNPPEDHPSPKPAAMGPRPGGLLARQGQLSLTTVTLLTE